MTDSEAVENLRLERMATGVTDWFFWRDRVLAKADRRHLQMFTAMLAALV
jgi:hypothetical protein